MLDVAQRESPLTIHEISDIEYAGIAAHADRHAPETLAGSYIMCMNLEKEFAGLREGACVWDIGTRGGTALKGLQNHGPFSRLEFYGVNPQVVMKPGMEEFAERRIMQGLVETLDTEVVKLAREKGIPLPHVIMLRNVLKFAHGRNNFEKAIRAIYNVLQPGGKVLIYEDLGSGLYPLYQQLLERMQTDFRIQEQEGNGQCKIYLCLTKPEENEA